MNFLFINFYEFDSTIHIPIESLVTIFVYKKCAPKDLKLNFFKVENVQNEPVFELNVQTLSHFEIVENLPYLAKFCTLPLLILENNTVISGLCSVSRQIVKLSPYDQIKKLLGFREACLLAPNECSIWTKFCEIDMISSIKHIFQFPENTFGNEINIPIHLTRFEIHMNQPVRLHNIYKVAQNENKNCAKNITTEIKKENLNLSHDFSEGPFMTLADMILYPQILIFDHIFRNFEGDIFDKFLPLTSKWLKKMADNELTYFMNEIEFSEKDALLKKNLEISEKVIGKSLENLKMSENDLKFKKNIHEMPGAEFKMAETKMAANELTKNIKTEIEISKNSEKQETSDKKIEKSLENLKMSENELKSKNIYEIPGAEFKMAETNMAANELTKNIITEIETSKNSEKQEITEKNIEKSLENLEISQNELKSKNIYEIPETEFNMVETNMAVKMAAFQLSFENKFKNFIIKNPKIIESKCEKTSLYVSDPKRYKPQNRIFTKQSDIENSLRKIKPSKIEAGKPFGYELNFDWDEIPGEANPLGGALPEKRMLRKRDQLENMVKSVIKIARDNDVIVDFCSGSGHLGILLAVKLRKCKIILLENKERSLLRAKERVLNLKLNNIVFLQCNLDYFCANFDIGVSLHACGVATDLVLQNCLSKNANFVCCPCCYGKVHETHHISYPRSEIFKSYDLTLREYLVLGHSADQTHDSENSKTKQGIECMNIIDYDRKLWAEEYGYQVYLSKMIPENCTPKNNILVGILNKKNSPNF